MAVYTKDSKLSEPIFEDPSIVPVINRFGIFLGVGDDRILESCVRKGVDPDFFLAVINTYLNPDYFPERIVERTHLSMVIDYLEKTDRYYSCIQLPNIDRHFNVLLHKRGGMDQLASKGSNLHLLNDFYREVKQDLETLIDNDLKYWFPLLKSNRQAALEQISNTYSDDMTKPLPYDNSGTEDKIRDLISFFVIHLKGEYDHNLCVAVISAINTLEKDIRQNNRIRDRILKPLCEK